MTHTLGPWRTVRRNRVNRAGEPTYDIMSSGPNPENWEMVCDQATEANARLIAAAPALLEACRMAEIYLAKSLSHKDAGEVLDTLRAALARVRP